MKKHSILGAIRIISLSSIGPNKLVGKNKMEDKVTEDIWILKLRVGGANIW